MRRFALGAIVLSAAVLAAVALVVVRTERTLRRSRGEVADQAQIPHELLTVHSAKTDFVRLGAPNGYSYGAIFQGKTVLAGPGGIAIGTPGAVGSRQLRTGVELPAATITGLAVGVVRGVSRPELIVATHGEGVLFLDDAAAGSVWQLRPKDAGLRDVTAVAAQASGELLIGTRNKGLLTYDGKTLSKFGSGLDGVPVTAVAAKDAELWIGTRDRGVFRWHAGQMDHIDHEAGLSDEQVESIAFGPAGVYVGTALGVDEFVDGKLNRKLGGGLFARAVTFHDDALYVATVDQGIFRIGVRAVTGSRRAIRAELTEPVKAESFLVAESGLFAVTANGLQQHEPSGAWTSLGSSEVAGGLPVLADRNVSALNFSPDGSLWVGYFDHGLDVVNLATGSVKHTEDDHVFCVNRIVADTMRGTMDVATADGLVLFDAAGRERQVMTRRDGLIADQVTDVAITRNGTVVATPAGITFVDASGVSSLYAFQGLVNNHVYALASDAATGTLMAGTLGGISVLGNTAVLRDAAVRRNLTTRNSGLKQNWITAIAAVPSADESVGKQRWFVGTYGGGVVELGADGQFAAMDGATRAMVVNPNAMLVTDRHVFAGSLGDGLFVYDRGSRRWSQVTAGLPSLNVTAFAERGGELYVGTENGVVHIAESRLAP